MKTKKYKVFLKGQNLWLNLDGQPERLGFYTTRFVEAATGENAATTAVQMIRDDPDISSQILNKPSDAPVVFAEEVEEIEPSLDVGYTNTGYTFYPDDEDG